MINFEITFDKVPQGEQTNRFLFRTDNIFTATKWANTVGCRYRIRETEDAIGIMYGEVIDLEMKLPKKEYHYYCIEASGSEELTDRFLIRVEEDNNNYRYIKQLIGETLVIHDFRIKMATFEDIVSSLYFDGEIANLCSAAELARGDK